MVLAHRGDAKERTSSSKMFDAVAYFRLVALPTADEFFAANSDPRRAMLACSAVLHVIDHVAHSRIADPATADREVARLTEELTDRSLAFKAVRAYGLASKHARLSRAFLKGFDLNRGINRPPSFVGRMMLGRTFLGDKIGGITIDMGGRQHVNLTKALQFVLALYRSDYPELDVEA